MGWIILIFQIVRGSSNEVVCCFLIVLMVWEGSRGFPVVRMIILDTGELYMMVSGFIFDVFLMIEIWKSDFFTDLDRSKRLSNEGPLP